MTGLHPIRHDFIPIESGWSDTSVELSETSVELSSSRPVIMAFDARFEVHSRGLRAFTNQSDSAVKCSGCSDATVSC